MINKKYLTVASVLLLIVLVSFTVSLRVMERSEVLRIYDEGNRVMDGLCAYNVIFSQGSVSLNKIIRVIDHFAILIGQCHPYLLGLTEAMSLRAMSVFGNADIDMMILLTNLVYLVILLLSVYGIGAALYGRKTGLLAALLVAVYPGVFGAARVAMLDFPLAAMVALSMFMLIKTKGFTSPGYSILTGIAMGLAMLVKETAVIFLIFPLAYYFLKSCIALRKGRVAVNFILAAVIFAVVAGSVYLRKENQQVFSFYLSRTYINVTSADYFYYLKNIWMLVGPAVLALGLPLAFSYVINLRRRDKLVFFWFIAPLILFSISPCKEPRLILPILPALSLIVSQEIYSGGLFKKFKFLYTVVLVIFAITQYAVINSGALRLPEDYGGRLGILCARRDPRFPLHARLLDFFAKEKEGSDVSKGWSNIVFFDDSGAISWPLSIYLAQNKIPAVVIRPLETDQSSKRNQQYYKEIILSADYVVERNEDYGWDYDFKRQIKEILVMEFSRRKDDFELIGDLELGKDYSLRIYKKKHGRIPL